jgi:hypothetical protein
MFDLQVVEYKISNNNEHVMHQAFQHS